MLHRPLCLIEIVIAERQVVMRLIVTVTALIRFLKESGSWTIMLLTKLLHSLFEASRHRLWLNCGRLLVLRFNKGRIENQKHCRRDQKKGNLSHHQNLLSRNKYRRASTSSIVHSPGKVIKSVRISHPDCKGRGSTGQAGGTLKIDLMDFLEFIDTTKVQ